MDKSLKSPGGQLVSESGSPSYTALAQDMAEHEEEPAERTGALANYCLLGLGVILAIGASMAGLGPVAGTILFSAPLATKAMFSDEKVFDFSNEVRRTSQELANIGKPGYEPDGFFRKIANALSTPVLLVGTAISGIGKFLPIPGLRFASTVAEGLIVTPVKVLGDLLDGHPRKIVHTITEQFAKTGYEAITAPIPLPTPVLSATKGIRLKDRTVRAVEKAAALPGKTLRSGKKSEAPPTMAMEAAQPAGTAPAQERGARTTRLANKQNRRQIAEPKENLAGLSV